LDLRSDPRLYRHQRELPELRPAPPCPITGAAGSVLLEDISPKLLSDLWRYGARVDPAPLSRDSARIGLWRSPAGLYFFDAGEPGGAAFYRKLYADFRAYDFFARHAAARADFAAGAALIRPGDRVLDVGGGDGAFADRVPGTDYTALDLHAAPRPGGPRVVAQTPEQHALDHPGAYDVVCGFQVIEHVTDPLGMAAAMVRCLRPGGLLVLAMPRFGSSLNRIPNMLLNLPPHHLSWWTDAAGEALVAALGLDPVTIGPLPVAGIYAIPAWIARLVPRRYRPGRYVRAGLGCHLATGFGYLVGWNLGLRLGLPRGEAPVELFIAARKPAGR